MFGFFFQIENYIFGNSDPKYLVYFERFPLGESTTWEDYSSNRWMIIGIGVLNIAPYAGNILNKATRAGKYIGLNALSKVPGASRFATSKITNMQIVK